MENILKAKNKQKKQKNKQTKTPHEMHKKQQQSNKQSYVWLEKNLWICIYFSCFTRRYYQ